MKKISSKKIFLFLVVAVVTCVVVYSCRKTDRVPEAKPEQVNSIEEKFFNSHRTADRTEKALVDFIKRKNDKEHFVEKTVQQIGFPRWDKAMTRAVKSPAQERGASDAAVITYIPFVRDSQNYVNASMVIRTRSNDTSFSYLCDWEYVQLPNNTTVISDSAEHFAVFFMVLDKNVFGHTKFEIVDTNLFKNGNKRTFFITLSGGGNAGGRSNLLTPIEVCEDVTVSYFEQCPYPNSVQCINGCDHCILCMSHFSYNYCWEEYIDDGGGGGGGGGTEGTGSGGGGSAPPDCPGIPALRNELVTNPCTPGWVPDPGGGNTPPYPGNPCQVVDSLLKTPAFSQHLNMLRDSTVIHHEKGISFTLPDSANNTHAYYGGQGTLAVTIAPGTPVDGIMHNHYDTSARLPIFSVDDLASLGYNLVHNEVRDVRTFTYTLVTDSTSYIIMIEDSTKFLNFVNSWMDNDKHISALRDHMYVNHHVGDEGLTSAQNESFFLETLSTSMTYVGQTGIGIKLFRGNSNMTIFSPIKLNSNGQVRPDPCQ